MKSCLSPPQLSSGGCFAFFLMCSQQRCQARSSSWPKAPRSRPYSGCMLEGGVRTLPASPCIPSIPPSDAHQEAGRWLDFLTAQTARGDAGGGRARLMLKSWRVASRATDTVEAVDSRAPSLRKPREPDQLRRRFRSSLRVWRHPQNWPGHVSHYVGGWGLLSGSAEMHQAGARCKFQRLAIASLRLVLAAPLLPLGSRALQSARDRNSSCRESRKGRQTKFTMASN